MTTCDVMFCIHEPQTNSEASSGREELSFGNSGIVEHFGVPDSPNDACVSEELVVPHHCALDLAREVLALQRVDHAQTPTRVLLIQKMQELVCAHLLLAKLERAVPPF